MRRGRERETAALENINRWDAAEGGITSGGIDSVREKNAGCGGTLTKPLMWVKRFCIVELVADLRCVNK